MQGFSTCTYRLIKDMQADYRFPRHLHARMHVRTVSRSMQGPTPRIHVRQTKEVLDCISPRLDTPEGFVSSRRLTPSVFDVAQTTYSDHRTDRAPTTSTTSRAAPPSSDHIDHGPRRPRLERLYRAPTTSTTRPRRNDDRREERRYDNHDHHHNRPKSTKIGQLYRHRPDFYPKISTFLIFIFNIIFITMYLHNVLIMIIL